MSQLDGDIVINRVSVFVSGRMIDRGVARVGIIQEAEVPAIGKAEHKFLTIKIADQQPVPGTRVNRPVTERDASSVDVASAGRVGPNLLDNVDEISNERGTGADRLLVALAGSRRGCRGQIAEDDGADSGNDFFDDIDREV